MHNYTLPESWQLQTDDDGRPLPCTHERLEPRIRTLSNGATAAYWQCLTCGAGTRAVSKSEHQAKLDARTNQPFDQKLKEDWRAAELEAWASFRAKDSAERSQSWWAGYNAYLASDAWRLKRQMRLEVDRYTCQAMLSGCLRRASEVHHLTYDHRGQEPLFELVSVCNPCHEKITAMDRARK